MNSLYDVYVDQLKDLYSAEQQLTEALPKMASAATNPNLKRAFDDHKKRTEAHRDTVRSILDELGEDPGGKVCIGMKALIEEGEEIIQKDGNSATIDAALIVAGQKAEHYEIASYGSLRTHANVLGYGDQQDQLQNILDDEGEADKKLTDLAEGGLFEEGLNEEAEV